MIKKIMKPSESSQNYWQNIQFVLSELLSELSHRSKHIGSGHIVGLSTGFKDLDAITMGLRLGSLCVIAGRPSMGQLLLALNIASHVALKEQLPVIIFSMEISASQVVQRLVGIAAAVDQYDVMTGCLEWSDLANIEKASKDFMVSNVIIDESPGLTIKQICARTRDIVTLHGRLGMVVIDDLQHLSPAISTHINSKRCEAMMAKLRCLAYEINAPIVVLSQLKRKLEYRKNKRPSHTDLPAIQIAQYADLLLYVYRDEVYNKDSKHPGTAEILISRNRHGPNGAIRLSFNSGISSFGNL